MPAMPAFEISVLMPESRQKLPSFSASVRTAARSEPASGSVTANAARISPWVTAGSQRFFWISLPTSETACEPRPCIANVVSASDEK
jgi:hypothetical protein